MYSCNQKNKKRMNQILVLEDYYLKFPIWKSSLLEEISKDSGLTKSQVYKWYWDMKKKKEEMQSYMNDSENQRVNFISEISTNSWELKKKLEREFENVNMK